MVEPSPYRSDRQYARLETYRRAGLPDQVWAQEQFGVQVRFSTAGRRDYQQRAGDIWETVDRLPLQVKDIIRGLIDEIHIDHDASFLSGTLGTWRDGMMRINRDWSLIPGLRDQSWHKDLGYDLLRAALVHESGHALVEDPRGGIPLRHFMRLVAASGWLPHPLDDPIPYGPIGRKVELLSAYYLDRLRHVDPGWDPEAPLGAPGMPSSVQLDRDLMYEVGRWTLLRTSDRGSLRLQGPEQLLARLRAEDPTRLKAGLKERGLSLEEIDVSFRRRRAPTRYAEESISETPAEIFRYIHAPYTRAEHSRPALEEGERLLLEPWRVAERSVGARRPPLGPERPWEAIQLVRRGPGRELGR